MKVLFVIASFCFFMYCISESLEEERKLCENKQGYEFIKPVGRNQPWQCVKIEEGMLDSE